MTHVGCRTAGPSELHHRRAGPPHPHRLPGPPLLCEAAPRGADGGWHPPTPDGLPHGNAVAARVQRRPAAPTQPEVSIDGSLWYDYHHPHTRTHAPSLSILTRRRRMREPSLAPSLVDCPVCSVTAASAPPVPSSKRKAAGASPISSATTATGSPPGLGGRLLPAQQQQRPATPSTAQGVQTSPKAPPAKKVGTQADRRQAGRQVGQTVHQPTSRHANDDDTCAHTGCPRCRWRRTGDQWFNDGEKKGGQLRQRRRHPFICLTSLRPSLPR